MNTSGRHIVFIIPGLCGPVSDPPVSDYLQDRPAALDRLVSRSQVKLTACTDLESTLCRWFGVSGDQQAALPIAPLTRLSDTGQSCAEYVMRADPVHLRADQSQLRLFDSHTFEITQVEADALVLAFNRFYIDRGWQLEALRPQRWYLTLPAEPRVTTLPLARVAGQAVDPFLPQGAEATAWHATLNEVQMLFHDHAVNREREQRGEPAINSVWFWGGGVLPAGLQTAASQVLTDHPLGMGLAQRANIPRRDLPADVDELYAQLCTGMTLMINDGLAAPTQYGDIGSWEARLRKLEQDWFVPLLGAVRSGEISSLEIDPCQGESFRVTRWQLQQFWKRNRPFESMCHYAD